MVESLSLESRMRARAELLARFLDSHFHLNSSLAQGQKELFESCRYSLLQEGSKRFRPVLAMLTAEALGRPHELSLAFSAAVECVHTYSLIHDDLPAMDNDDFRRGQPTNHKKFGEATAILAGDGLLTEAFQIIASNYIAEPEIAVRLVAETAQAAGLFGMVGGQAIDMNAKKEVITLEALRNMHRLKTGALIRLSALGAALISRASEAQLREITEYAECLGLAFQVADDVLDFDPEKVEPGSYPALLGIEKTREFLDQLTEDCLHSIRNWPSSAEPLRDIARFNRARQN
jgi:geranylgeranyl diphosphate synthase, type II